MFRFNWLAFLAALGLMSWIPINLFPGHKQISAEHLRLSQVWYPWVGVILGLLMLLWCVMAPASWSPFLSGLVLTLIWVCFTGALHLDGLADSVDAWVGGMGDKEKTLRIMKDPCSGPMAVVSLTLILLLKVALIGQIMMLDSVAVLMLALIPMMARSWLLPLLFTTEYARQPKFDAQKVQVSDQQGGMASDIAGLFPARQASISFLASQLLWLLVVLVSGYAFWVWLVVNLLALLVFVLIRQACLSRLDGYTGDVLGAFIEIQEGTLLFAIAWILAP